MSPLCALLHSSFADYAADTLPAPQRRILREHLIACPPCRELAAAEDLTLLFARSIREEIPEAQQQQILATVRTGVSLMESQRRIGRSSRRRLGGVAAAAAVAALVLLIPGSAIRRFPAPSAAGRASTPGGSAPAPSTAAAAIPADGALQPVALGETVEPASSGATVYNWNPGAAREEPRVVWIVDRGLDI